MSNARIGIFDDVFRPQKPTQPFIYNNQHLLPIFLVFLQVTMQLCVVTAANFGFARPETEINRTAYDI